MKRPVFEVTSKALGDLFVTEIVGMQYQFQVKHKYEHEYFKLIPGTEVKIIREPENRVDANACAVSLRRKRIGYLPAKVAKEVARRLDNGEEIRFFVFDLAHSYQGFIGLPTTSLLGIRTERLTRRKK